MVYTAKDIDALMRTPATKDAILAFLESSAQFQQQFPLTLKQLTLSSLIERKASLEVSLQAVTDALVAAQNP